jgi:transketolase
MRNDLIKFIFDKAKKNKNIILLTGDLGYSLFDEFAQKLPNQFFNIGISEQNMIAVATGLAKEKKKVFVYSIGNFPSLRCLEFIRNNLCYHNLDVTIISCGTGYEYGQLGFSHHATEVLSVIRSIPNISIFNPATLKELKQIKRKIFLNQPKFLMVNKNYIKENMNFHTFPIKKKINGKILICTTGSILEEAMKASVFLNKKNIKTEIISFPFIKPLIFKTDFINSLKKFNYIFSLEENNISGGFGELFLNLINKNNLKINFEIIGIKDEFIKIVGDKNYLRKKARIDSKSVISYIEKKMKN